MKRAFFLLLSALLVAGTARAQTQAGHLLLTGGGAFTSFTRQQPNSKERQGRFNALAGYFVADNVALGGSFGFNASRQEYRAPGGQLTQAQKRNVMSAGVFARRYWHPAERMALFGELAASYLWLNQRERYGEERYPEQHTSGNGLGVGMRPGLAYFPTDYLGLELIQT